MKKTLIMALTVIMLASFAGCSASGNNENSSSASENSEITSNVTTQESVEEEPTDSSSEASKDEPSKESSNETSKESSLSSTVSNNKTQLTFNGFVKEVSDGNMTVETIAEEEEASQETYTVVVYNDSINESTVSPNMVVTVKYTGSFSKDGETFTVQADSWEAL